MGASEYSAACEAIVDTFVAAFPGYLEARLAEVAPDFEATESIRQGREWLEGELSQWARLPAEEQRRGPLQIFQTAFAFPTAAMEEAGIPPPQRDAGAATALPGDSYGLAPASSRQIGEAAWKSHIAWGVAKAHAVTAATPRPDPGHSAAIAIVSMERTDRDEISAVATSRGIATRHWRNPGAISAGLAEEIPRWAAVDDSHAAADAAVRDLAAAGSRVLVFGSAPDDIAMARWMALGAMTVVGRDRLSAVLEAWLPVRA